MKKSLVVMVGLLAACSTTTLAGETPNVPDLTKSILCQEGKSKGQPWPAVTHDMNLGPTGLRGWMWADAKLAKPPPD